jgi:hypothetical protein
MIESMSPAQPRPTGQKRFEKKEIYGGMLVISVMLDV